MDELIQPSCYYCSTTMYVPEGELHATFRGKPICEHCIILQEMPVKDRMVFMTLEKIATSLKEIEYSIRSIERAKTGTINTQGTSHL